ncbi:ATP phosphoribosyltransferase regulatory subunit [Formosimonas limnophila]|uniref:ATP phosphoribosyltransferase regulatory subunit n=1 Tax=Formosimonas limnophila TaxID=1384487 RepID=A0A8J3CHH1_9BURK|nr:ATP phosphoribosyltransferase regulatory subunit [Formosimonas limnophila]GHA73948.1 ATP phosphoribosyltransferase regulatory subunit [Formosimonas limnophila]
MTNNAWMLPDQISDVLPRQASTLEGLRRGLLDLYQQYGYELVMPPLVEYTDALLDDADEDVNLRTVKWADAMTGKTLAIRADITPQVARIDAHLLNRQGVTRLCYSGSVFHARANGLLMSREPMHVGAEVYGHEGLEADAEIQTLLLASLRLCGLKGLRLDVSHAGIVRALLSRAPQLASATDEVYAALQAKDAVVLRALTIGCDHDVCQGLLALLDLYGGVDVIARARALLPVDAVITAALDDLSVLADLDTSGVLQFDLADLTGYHYHTGVMFAAYCSGAPSAIARGGRYDHIGERFGRARPATGFSLDLREITELMVFDKPVKAIRAPWLMDAALRAAIDVLRANGEIVIQLSDDASVEQDAFVCDRELVSETGVWSVRSL